MHNARVAIVLITLCLLIPTRLFSSQADNTGRVWGYINYTMLFSPNWAFVIMPGYSYEFMRSDSDKNPPHGAQSNVLHELSFGPAYITKAGEFTFKLPLWYNYQAYPVAYRNMYHFSHNLDFLPIIQYKHNALELITRSLFENKIYSTKVPRGSDKQGYSLQVRPLARINYWLGSDIALTLADELFFGLVQDSNNKSASEPAFVKKGFSENRFMAGIEYKFSPFMSIAPQYMLRTDYSPAAPHRLLEIDHCIYIQFNYVARF